MEVWWWLRAWCHTARHHGAALHACMHPASVLGAPLWGCMVHGARTRACTRHWLGGGAMSCALASAWRITHAAAGKDTV